MNEILAAMDTVKYDLFYNSVIFQVRDQLLIILWYGFKWSRCYAWESSFQSKVQSVRTDELSWFKKASLLGAVRKQIISIGFIFWRMLKETAWYCLWTCCSLWNTIVYITVNVINSIINLDIEDKMDWFMYYIYKSQFNFFVLNTSTIFFRSSMDLC